MFSGRFVKYGFIFKVVEDALEVKGNKLRFAVIGVFDDNGAVAVIVLLEVVNDGEEGGGKEVREVEGEKLGEFSNIANSFAEIW